MALSYHSIMIQKPDLSLSDWNWAVLMLTQALIGAVSSNFRLVALAFEDAKWVLQVILREESDVDREEINEICDDFLAFMTSVQNRISKRADADITPHVIVSQDPIYLSDDKVRYVFRAREE